MQVYTWVAIATVAVASTLGTNHLVYQHDTVDFADLTLMAHRGHADPKEHVILQQGRTFDVTDLTIKKGEVLVFTNKDDVTHNVFSLSPSIKFDIKTQRPGETSKMPFPNAGSGDIRCAIHPSMKLKLTVIE